MAHMKFAAGCLHNHQNQGAAPMMLSPHIAAQDGGHTLGYALSVGMPQCAEFEELRRHHCGACNLGILALLLWTQQPQTCAGGSATVQWPLIACADRAGQSCQVDLRVMAGVGTGCHLHRQGACPTLQLLTLLAPSQHGAAQLLCCDHQPGPDWPQPDAACGGCTSVLKHDSKLGAVQRQLGPQGAAALLPHHAPGQQHCVDGRHALGQLLADVRALGRIRAVQVSQGSGLLAICPLEVGRDAWGMKRRQWSQQAKTFYI